LAADQEGRLFLGPFLDLLRLLLVLAARWAIKRF
jgi:hypothetical protein